jgi:pimeloyl-ACP methyl ester carboxylesterase
VLVGQSQGSGAALGAAYAAPLYAPGVNVRGVVATGLVVSLAASVSGAPQVPVAPYAGGDAYDAAYSMLYLLGVDQFLDRTLDVDEYVSAQGADLLHAALTGCLTDVVAVARAQKLTPKVAFTPARERLLPLEDAILLFPSGKIGVPVFTGTGLADAEAETAPQYNFIADLCGAGTTVSWHYYPGLTHNGAVTASLADSVPFVDAVMSGMPVAGNCGSLVPPGPLQTPTPGVPHNT